MQQSCHFKKQIKNTTITVIFDVKNDNVIINKAGDRAMKRFAPMGVSTARRKVLLGTMMAACGWAVVGAALASDAAYPTRPITIVVPFPAGGSSDAIARLLAAELSPRLNQTVVVENKAGANGSIGSVLVAKAAPDGYTLLISGIGSNAINYGLYPKLSYSDKNFAHISLLTTGPNVIAVNPAFSPKSLKELVTYARTHPGQMQAANSGNGSSNHLGMAMLAKAAGFDVVHVPYKGGAPAIVDVIAGHVPVITSNQDALLPYVQSGKLRPIAVLSTERNPAYPDVPTAVEQGFPGFSAVSWFGLAAPAGTPQAIVDQLSKASAEVLNLPAIKQKLETIGFVVVGSTPQQAAAFVKMESDKWGEVVKTNGLTAE